MAVRYTSMIVDFVRRHRKGLTIFAVLALSLGMIFRGAMQIPHIRSGKAEAESLKKQIEYEKQRQNEIAALKDKVNTDEYIEKIASERLGLIKSNSKIFVDVSGEVQQSN